MPPRVGYSSPFSKSSVGRLFESYLKEKYHEKGMMSTFEILFLVIDLDIGSTRISLGWTQSLV